MVIFNSIAKLLLFAFLILLLGEVFVYSMNLL